MTHKGQTHPKPSALELSDEQEAELRRLLRYYKRETERCQKAKAYLAGCVMVGAELEAALLMMVNAFPDDVIGVGELPTRGGEVRPLLEWKLADLLRIAKIAGWLPAGLEYGKDEWSGRKAKIGDHAEVVRQIRNLTHPARYIEDHYKKRITNRHLELVIETIDGVSSWLFARIEKSLLERMKEEGMPTHASAAPEES